MGPPRQVSAAPGRPGLTPTTHHHKKKESGLFLRFLAETGHSMKVDSPGRGESFRTSTPCPTYHDEHRVRFRWASCRVLRRCCLPGAGAAPERRSLLHLMTKRKVESFSYH